jgi:uncharacterized membrane protein HdeD (DUF308 family)
MMMSSKMSDKDLERHIKWHGFWMMLLGIVVLINVYGSFLKWDAFIGLLLVLWGAKKVLHRCKK